MTSYTRSSRFTPSLPPLRSFAPPRVGTSPLSSSRLSGSSAAMDASTYSSSSRISSPPRSSRFQCTSYADYLRIKAMGGLPAPSHPPPPAPQRPIVFEHVATPWDPVPEFPDLSWHTISSSETYQTRTSTGSARTDTRTSALFYPRADLRLDAPVTSGRAAALPKPDPPAARWRPGTGNRLIDEIMRQDTATPRFSPSKRVRSLCMCPPTGKPFWRANCKKCNPPTQKVAPRPVPPPSLEPRFAPVVTIPTPVRTVVPSRKPMSPPIPAPKLRSAPIAAMPAPVKTEISSRQRILNWLHDCDTPLVPSSMPRSSRPAGFLSFVGEELKEVWQTSLKNWNDTWTSLKSLWK